MTSAVGGSAPHSAERRALTWSKFSHSISSTGPLLYTTCNRGRGGAGWQTLIDAWGVPSVRVLFWVGGGGWGGGCWGSREEEWLRAAGRRQQTKRHL
jgi:hypothetical protein